MANRPASLGAWPGGRILVLSPTPSHPQDYGNRKRIFQVCSRYAEEGARITYVHYPAEFEWRGALPAGAERGMMETWDQYYTIAPTRDLHSDPEGDHHLIDEWWDDAIGQFLRWLFSVQSFDVFIVNYSWLSKAFEYAPPRTFKILDTHDKVSGRREMLVSLGLNPEFFYTTEWEETLALQRADLVWAIKSEERALFERMSATPVLTVPHLDPARALAPPAPDPDGFLRVGVIGARNNVNRMNISEFLAAAEPVFLENFAPIKIVIAGSVCDLLKDTNYPFVDLRGRIEDIEDFYSSVDCVAVPMRCSTGLKIKTGEALSLGKPLVSLAHAFEGYEPAHPLHGLADFDAMARALCDLAFAPRESLVPLAEASRAAHAKTNALIAASFKAADALARDRGRSIVLAVDSRAFVPDSVFNLSLLPMQEYLRDLANVTVLVTNGSIVDVLANQQMVDRLRRVVVAANVAGAAASREDLAEAGVDVFPIADYLKRAQPNVLVIDTLHPVFSRLSLPGTTVISRAEMIAHARGGTDFRPPVRGYRRSFVAVPRMSEKVAALAGATGATPLLARCFSRPPEIKVQHARDGGGANILAILGTGNAPAVRMALAMAHAWKMRPQLVFGFDDRAAPDGAAVSFRTDKYIASILEGRVAVPHAAIDLSAGRLGLSLCREVLELLHVPVVTASTAALQRSLGPGSGPYRVATERELWDAIRAFAVESDSSLQDRFKPVWRNIEGARDWQWLLRYGMTVLDGKDAEAA